MRMELYIDLLWTEQFLVTHLLVNSSRIVIGQRYKNIQVKVMSPRLAKQEMEFCQSLWSLYKVSVTKTLFGDWKRYTDDQVSGSTWQHWPPGHFEAVHHCDPCSWVFQTQQCDSEGQFGGVPGVYPLSSQEYWGVVQCKNKGKEEGDNYPSGKALEVLLLPLQLLLLGISSSRVWRGKCSSSSTSASTSTSSRPYILSKGMGSIITD